MKKKSNTYFTYAGYQIPVSFIMRLKNKKKLRAYEIDRLIYRAVKYCEYLKRCEYLELSDEEPRLIEVMVKGMQEGWLFKVTHDEEYKKEKVEAWIAREIYHRKPEPKRVVVDRYKKPERLGNIVKDLI